MLDSAALGDLIAEIAGDAAQQAASPAMDMAQSLKSAFETMVANQVTREFVDSLVQTTAALVARLEAMEAAIAEVRQIETVSPAVLSQKLTDVIAAIQTPEPIPAPEIDMDEVQRRIDGAVTQAVSALPPAEKGDPGEVDGALIATMIDAAVKEAVDALPVPEPVPAKEVDMQAVAQMVGEMVSKATNALPAPEPGKDGVGMADALIDRDGNLVLTMTDGSTKGLGRVEGKDAPTFTLDDFNIEQVDERVFVFKFTHGDKCHSFEFSFPVVLDRGVWREQKAYSRGDGVTWAGSYWIAQRSVEAGEKPDTPGAPWRLAVKRGQNGKDLQP